MKPILRISKGFTILEFVLATSLSLMVIGVVVSAYIVSMRVFNQQISQSDIFWDGHRAVETMTKEIRECLEVTSAEASTITFWWKDLDGSTTRDANETVSYALANQNLRRTIGSTSRGIANNVTSLSFAYNTNPNPSLVTVTVTLSRQGETTTVESKARIRNE
ncbi:MAG: hypothetical protein KJ732_05515 [Candidatus Margulisbacteria bacterium]|nr:hypothetical protein [Candidatus Margulisiibacteriota bacterium]